MKRALLVCSAALAMTVQAEAATFTLSVEGTDAIFLAGRTDVAIPPASDPWADNNAATDDGLRRHAGPTPEEALETRPESISVMGGDVVRVLDPAQGGINFFNGFGPPYFGPEGNVGIGSNLTSLGGLSGYIGTQGALAGVFLDDSIPNGLPPSTLDFSTPLSRDFLSLAPGLGQIFFIGNGETSGGTLQEFIAPIGATRLFFGIPDGFGFQGVPGAYDDNDGSYRIRVGINEIPTPAVPLPAGGLLLLSGLAALALRRARRA